MKKPHCDGCGKQRKIWKVFTDEDGRKRYCQICWSAHANGKSSKPTSVKKRLRPRSLKRIAQEKEYSQRRKVFLIANPYCQVAIPGICTHRSTEIHHTNDRFGDNLNDEQYWKAVDRPCHKWIHANPQTAKEMGLLL